MRGGRGGRGRTWTLGTSRIDVRDRDGNVVDLEEGTDRTREGGGGGSRNGVTVDETLGRDWG